MVRYVIPRIRAKFNPTLPPACKANTLRRDRDAETEKKGGREGGMDGWMDGLG